MQRDEPKNSHEELGDTAKRRLLDLDADRHLSRLQGNEADPIALEGLHDLRSHVAGATTGVFLPGQLASFRRARLHHVMEEFRWLAALAALINPAPGDRDEYGVTDEGHAPQCHALRPQPRLSRRAAL